MSKMASNSMRKLKKSPKKTQLLRQIFEYSDLVHLEEETRKCIAKNDIVGAVLCMEKRLHLHREYFGPHSEQLYEISREYCEFCHQQALVALKDNDFVNAKKYLIKAEVSVFENEPLQLAIYKTMACYLRGVNQLRASMDFLKKAKCLVMKNLMKYQVDQIEILLNLCSVVSQLGKHQKAYLYAQQALIVIQEQRLFVPHKKDGSYSSDSKEMSLFLAVAYHNLAVEEEFLHEYTKSLESYRKAAAIAETELGPKHPMTKSMNVSLLAAEEALEKKTLQQVLPMYSHISNASRGSSSNSRKSYRVNLADSNDLKQKKNKLQKAKHHDDSQDEEFAEWDGTSRPSTANSGAPKLHQVISQYGSSPKRRHPSRPSSGSAHRPISSETLDAYGNIDFDQAKQHRPGSRQVTSQKKSRKKKTRFEDHEDEEEEKEEEVEEKKEEKEVKKTSLTSEEKETSDRPREEEDKKETSVPDLTTLVDDTKTVVSLDVSSLFSLQKETKEQEVLSSPMFMISLPPSSFASSSSSPMKEQEVQEQVQVQEEEKTVALFLSPRLSSSTDESDNVHELLNDLIIKVV